MSGGAGRRAAEEGKLLSQRASELSIIKEVDILLFIFLNLVRPSIAWQTRQSCACAARSAEVFWTAAHMRSSHQLIILKIDILKQQMSTQNSLHCPVFLIDSDWHKRGLGMIDLFKTFLLLEVSLGRLFMTFIPYSVPF